MSDEFYSLETLVLAALEAGAVKGVKGYMGLRDVLHTLINLQTEENQ